MFKSIIQAFCLVADLGFDTTEKLFLFHESSPNDLRIVSCLWILRENVNFTIHILNNIMKVL